MKKILIGVITLLMLASCVTVPSQSPPPNSPVFSNTIKTSTKVAHLPTSVPHQAPDLSNCPSTKYLSPTLPEKIPEWNALDESIGLHVTGKYQIIDPKTYRLKVSGRVDKPLELTYDQIRCLPAVTDTPRLNCPGVFVDNASWTGVPLKTILDLVGMQAGADELVLISGDGFQTKVTIKEALDQNSFVAYEVNGQILPILHGFPIRAVFPKMDGANWVKWLVEIQVK